MKSTIYKRASIDEAANAKAPHAFRLNPWGSTCRICGRWPEGHSKVEKKKKTK